MKRQQKKVFIFIPTTNIYLKKQNQKREQNNFRKKIEIYFKTVILKKKFNWDNNENMVVR